MQSIHFRQQTCKEQESQSKKSRIQKKGTAKFSNEIFSSSASIFSREGERVFRRALASEQREREREREAII